MRPMTHEEAQTVIRRCKWATICTVSENGAPYAVEATPFYMEGRHCFMINPRGGTWKNVRGGSRVLLKYTLTTDDLDFWAGVSCSGTGEFVLDSEALRQGWRRLGEVMGADYSEAARRFERLKDRSPLFCVRVEETTGRCSAPRGEAMRLPELLADRPGTGHTPAVTLNLIAT